MNIKNLKVGQRVIFICPENARSSFCHTHDKLVGTIKVIPSSYCIILVQFDYGSASACYTSELEVAP
jgi:hypothetical protein